MANVILIVALLGGGVIGFVIAWVVRGKEVKTEKGIREDLKKEMDQLDIRFKGIAGDVLRTHSKDFLEEFDKSRKLNDIGLDNREKGFEKTVDLLSKSVEAVQTKVSEFEKQRAEQFGALGESIKTILNTGAKMQEAALSLKTVLSSASAVRGRWGEAVLKNLLEESGLTEGLDFRVQETIAGEEAALRPDVVINIPGGLQLAIDSKAGLEEFFKAVEEKDADKKREHIVQFSQNLRGHIRALAGKEYQKYLDPRIPYVIMFIPGEAAVRAAFEQDVDLYREAQEKRVMLASPATIMPLILLIAHAWKQHKSAENAGKLVNEVSVLGDRLKVFLGHVASIGGSLSQATEKFNKAASSWDARVYPQIDRIKSLGGNIEVDDEIPQVQVEPRLPGKAIAPPAVGEGVDGELD